MKYKNARYKIGKLKNPSEIVFKSIVISLANTIQMETTPPEIVPEMITPPESIVPEVVITEFFYPEPSVPEVVVPDIVSMSDLINDRKSF